MSVAVVGAGIVGLTTAAHIQDILPHVQVKKHKIFNFSRGDNNISRVRELQGMAK